MQAETFFRGFGLLPNAGFGLPAVVRLEVLSNYRERLEDNLAKLQKPTQKLNSLLISPAIDLPEVSVDEAVDAYDKHLELALSSTGFETLPGPSLDPDLAMRRAVEKHPPFDDRGRGFQDYLIWLTILETLATIGPPVAFISANKSDFGDSELLPELRADLVRLGFDHDAVQLFNSLEAFNEEHIIPKLHDVEVVHSELESHDGVGAALRKHLADNLPDHIPSELILSAWGLPPDAGEAFVSSVWLVDSIHVEEAFQIEEGTFLVDMEAEVEAHQRLIFREDDYERSPELRELLSHTAFDDTLIYQVSGKLTLNVVVVVETDPVGFRDPEVAAVQRGWGSARAIAEETSEPTSDNA